MNPEKIRALRNQAEELYRMHRTMPDEDPRRPEVLHRLQSAIFHLKRIGIRLRFDE